MIRIAVCEDDAYDREQLELCLPRAAKRMDLECEADYLASGQELVNRIASGSRYDLLILDILMDELNGIETAKEAKKLLPGVWIGFLTSSVEYALDAFEVDALHYLVKPVSEDALAKLLERYLERTQRGQRVLTLNTSQGEMNFPMRSIQKVESYRKGVAVYTYGRSEPWQINRSFTYVEEQLDKEVFLHISRGLAVNMDFVENISQGVCQMEDGTSVLVSRGERAKVQKKFNEYLFDRMKDIRSRIQTE